VREPPSLSPEAQNPKYPPFRREPGKTRLRGNNPVRSDEIRGPELKRRQLSAIQLFLLNGALTMMKKIVIKEPESSLSGQLRFLFNTGASNAVKT
jgi:hypothetical protein